MQLFTEHAGLKPPEWARLVGFYPISASWSYLRRHWRRGFLRRKRDWKGELVYSIAPAGARYLLWWKQKFPDAKV